YEAGPWQVGGGSGGGRPPAPGGGANRHELPEAEAQWARRHDSPGSGGTHRLMSQHAEDGVGVEAQRPRGVWNSVLSRPYQLRMWRHLVLRLPSADLLL